MARSRKHHERTPDADLGGRENVTAGPGGPNAPGTAKGAPRGIQSQSTHKLAPDPPRPRVWFLVASSVALAAWMVFLVVIALHG